jgi:hypothetical protein
MSTFSMSEILDDFSDEVAEVSGATTFLLQGTDEMVAPLWKRAATWSGGGVEGVAEGLPATVVDGATMRWMETLV